MWKPCPGRRRGSNESGTPMLHQDRLLPSVLAWWMLSPTCRWRPGGCSGCWPIRVDAGQRTSNPKVFAAGDVSDAPQYVYVAAATGRAAALNALGGTERVDYAGLP